MRRRALIPLLATLAIAATAVFQLRKNEGPKPADTTPVPAEPPSRPRLSDLASAPEWSQLDAWQESVSRSEFIRMMDSVFTVSPAWREWFHVRDDAVEITTSPANDPYVLRFSSTETGQDGPSYWRATEKLPPASVDQPLQELRIAIDPGHIGGDWAEIEERWFRIGDDRPVMEGSMTLEVALLLKPKLESLGATVTLVRDRNAPVTEYRPEGLMAEASELDPNSPAKLAERLFYRTAEIRARADLVNHTIRPDLVLCLHFNAEAWGDPTNPTLVPRNHFHLILNGAYMDEEVGLEDQRFEIARKIVERIHPEEAALAESVAMSFVRASGLPPFLYEADSLRAKNIAGNPYLWARNLLANRLYRCPVVFLEPYVMNSVEDYRRIQMGHYDGLKEVDGALRPSIFSEYADAVAEGLAAHYRSHRPQSK